MAKIGFKRFYWAMLATEPETSNPTYEKGTQLGKAVSCNVAVTNAEGELYADDQLAEYAAEFSSAQLTAQVDNIPLDKQAMIYGAQFVDDELLHNSNDTPPYGGVGGFQTLMVEGKRKFRAWVFTKAKAAIPDEDSTTRGNNISFGTQPVDMKIMAPKYGPWKRVKEFETEAAADAYVQTLLNVSEWFKAQIMLMGDGTASHNGTVNVASGEALEITFSKAPTKLYDNGEDKTASLSGSKYTVAAVGEDHKICAIF